jgi:hypothetical protein
MTAGNSNRILLFVAAVFLCGCGSSPESSVPPEPDVESLRAEVLAAEDAMNLAVDGLDCESGLALIGDAEPIFVTGGNVVRTRSVLMDMCEQMVAPRTGAVFTADSRTANLLSDDAAMVVREGNYAISFKDGTSVEQYMVMTTVWTRGSDGWMMVHLHESFRPQSEN